MMQTLYTPPDEQVFRLLFKQDRLVGGSLNGDIKIFTPKSPYIRGSEWFSRTAIPLFKKFIAPNLIDFGSNFLKDITSGKSAKSSAKKRGMQSLKNTVKKVLTGQGRRLKKMGCTKPKAKAKKRKPSKKKIGGKKRKVKISRKKNIIKRKRTSKNRKCIFDSNFSI